MLIAWENEAYLALEELGPSEFEIVVPSLSILAEPPVALVEGNLKSDEQRKLATEYLNWLYSPEAQALAAGGVVGLEDSARAHGPKSKE